MHLNHCGHAKHYKLAKEDYKKVHIKCTYLYVFLCGVIIILDLDFFSSHVVLSLFVFFMTPVSAHLPSSDHKEGMDAEKSSRRRIETRQRNWKFKEVQVQDQIHREIRRGIKGSRNHRTNDKKVLTVKLWSEHFKFLYFNSQSQCTKASPAQIISRCILYQL